MLLRLQPCGTGLRRPSRCTSCMVCTRCSHVAASCTARMPAGPGSAWPSFRMSLILLLPVLLLMPMLMVRRWAPWRVRRMSPPRSRVMRHPRSHARQRSPRRARRQRILHDAWLRPRWGPAGAPDPGCTAAAAEEEEEGSHDDAATWTASSPYMYRVSTTPEAAGGGLPMVGSGRVRD